MSKINQFNLSQQSYNLQMQKKMSTVDAKQASVAAQTGASNQLNEKSKTERKGPTEGLSPELQAKLNAAAEKEAEADATAQARQSVADDALVQNKSTKRKDIEEKDDSDYGVGQGDVKTKDGSRVLELDGGDDGETFQITKAEGEKLDRLDGRSPEQILAGMPENSRKAAEATLDTQIKTQGKEKVAQLKDDPKITAKVEEMDLEPVGSLRDEAKVAPIRTPKDEPPMMVVDEASESMAKEAAIRQMQQGGGEAMLAS